MTDDHVHGEHTVTTESGRVFCSCGYERVETTSTTTPVRTYVGWAHVGGTDPEAVRVRALLRARFAA